MTPDERARAIADRLTCFVTDEDVAMIAAAIRDAVAEKEAEIVGLRGLVQLLDVLERIKRIGEGMRDHWHPSGGKPWHESNARAAMKGEET